MKAVERVAKDLGLSITATEVFLDLPVSAMVKAQLSAMKGDDYE